MGTLFEITIFLVTATILINWCDGVQFYNHPIPIPVQSNNAVDPASQFLVNHENDGSYHFGYTVPGGNPTMYREEIREKSGRITGRYAYIDPNGILRVTEYVADEQGFHSTESQHVLFDNSDLQLIGPIPKTSRQLQKDPKSVK